MTPRQRRTRDWAKIAAVSISLIGGYVDLRGRVRAQEAPIQAAVAGTQAQGASLASALREIAALKRKVAALERAAVRSREPQRPGPAYGPELGPRPGTLATVGEAVKGAVTLPFRGLWALVRAIGS